MNLRSRLDRAEKNLPKDDVKIVARLWDEDKEPWPETPEAKRKIEATRPGITTIWVERKTLERRKINE